MTERAADLEQELIADYRVMELEGDHYEVGYQMGTATPLREVDALRRREGYSTFPVVDSQGRLLGLITRRDYDARIHGDVIVQAIIDREGGCRTLGRGRMPRLGLHRAVTAA